MKMKLVLNFTEAERRGLAIRYGFGNRKRPVTRTELIQAVTAWIEKEKNAAREAHRKQGGDPHPGHPELPGVEGGYVDSTPSGGGM